MNRNRWRHAISGVVVMLFAGLIYGWSVYQAAMAAEFPGWAVSQFSLNFSLCLTFFCFGTLACGILGRRLSVRLLMTAAAALIFLGFLISARMHSPGQLYLGYGVLSGFSIGMVYNLVLATTLKWFPDRAGLLSGILLMGFGFSSMLITPIFTRINLLAGWRTAFLVIGTMSAVVFLAVGWLLKPPPEGYVVPGQEKNPVRQESRDSGCTPGQMLKQPTFWLYFCWAVVLSAAGLAVNSHSYAMAAQVLANGSPALAGGANLAAVLAMLVSLFSVFNGIGRLAFGAVFDRLGRGRTMATICAVYFVACGIMAVAFMQGRFLMMATGLILCGFSYGGVQPCNSAFIRMVFGAKYYSVNFSIVTLNLLAASYLGPLLSGRLYDAQQSYLGTILCTAVFAVIAALCTGLLANRRIAGTH